MDVNLAILAAGATTWVLVAILCVRHVWVCPALFLLMFGYKDWLANIGLESAHTTLDPLLHVALWSTICIVWKLGTNSRPYTLDWSSLTLFALLAIWMLVSVSWSRAPGYGFYKTARFAFFGGTAYAVSMLVRDDVSFKRLCWFLMLGSLPMAVALLTAPTYNASGRACLGDAPLNVAVSLAITAVMGISLGRAYGVANRCILYGLSVLLTIAIVPTGSRAFVLQPILALAIIVFLRQRLFGIVLLALVAGLFLLDAAIPDFGRATHISLQNESEAARLTHWKTATKGALRTVVGHGAGDYAYEFFGEDTRGFPHNFLLEAWYELGLLGLSLYLVWWLRPAILWRQIRKAFLARGMIPDALSADLGIVFITTNLAILPHFDLADNRMLYVVMGLFVGRSLRIRQSLRAAALPESQAAAISGH